MVVSPCEAGRDAALKRPLQKLKLLNAVKRTITAQRQFAAISMLSELKME
jgi:hypothetical protein